MQENFDLVQKGFRILVGSMSGFIGQKLSGIYGNKWWDQVFYKLEDQKDIPINGSYSELVDSLDIANCIRIIDRMWNDTFRDILNPNCRTWAKELMGVRNIVAHIGMQDLEQPMAERALDTMALLCKEIDEDGEIEIREVYKEVRSRAADYFVPVKAANNFGVEQPDIDGSLSEGSLLNLVGTDLVQKTSMTRKVTFDGKTEIYPVYKVRLDALFYNDRNDRISTWITSYESENGTDSLKTLDKDIYNRIIENFVYGSNPEDTKKTQNNISLIGQREPGVSLADGRIVDGNRRFTCLRRIQRESAEPVYFETVIMNMDIHADKKQIKLLELAIQHGEEKKVDYNSIDYAIGTYRDVVLTNLLTVEEYAATTNESIVETKKRIDVAQLICEFLDFIKLPAQYHIAREYQIYDILLEMLVALKPLDDENKSKLKKIVFNNIIMKAIGDQRKFIRDIKSLIKNGKYDSFFEDQNNISSKIEEKYSEENIRTKVDIDAFADKYPEIRQELIDSLERALLRMRSKQLNAKPAENVSKSINLLMDIDSRLFPKMNPEERENLKAEIDELSKIVNGLKNLI